MLAKNLSWPNDISLTKDDQPVQLRKIKFPSHMIGRQYRSFSPSLYDKYLWLEYSECEKTLCTAFTANISPQKEKSRPLLPMVRGIKKDAMDQNQLTTNFFNITPAFSMPNLLQLTLTTRISNLVNSNLLLNFRALSTQSR